jgi:Nodulation protein Z (NodZ)
MFKRLIFALFCFILFFNGIALKAEQKERIIIKSFDYHAGMFSVFNTIMGFLYYYDHKQLSGLEVNFEETGVYYEAGYGPNWWNYYCLPLNLGDSHSSFSRFASNADRANYAYFTEYQLSRFEVNALIKKYIQIQPVIQQQVEEFCQKNFQNQYIIGVHYRGTDKTIESEYIQVHEVLIAICEHIDALELKDYKIYLATDETAVVDCFKEYFPDKLVYQSAYRSENGLPIHYFNENAYQTGKEALIDSLLLSKTNFLIRTESNLSLWSIYFNPDLNFVTINKRLTDHNPHLPKFPFNQE